MSQPNDEMVMSITVGQRRFQIVIAQEDHARWVATMKERSSAFTGTRPLGSIATNESVGAALHLAIDKLLDTLGLAGEAKPGPLPQPPTSPETPWRRL